MIAATQVGAGRRPAPLRSDGVFWGLALLTIVLHVWLGLSYSPNYRGPMCFVDEGYRLYPALRLMAGQELFRDMFTAYPPLSYYLHKWAFELLGVQLSSVRFVLVLSQTATTLVTYAIARRFMGRGSALFPAALTIAYGIGHLLMGYSGWYVMPLVLLTLLFVLRFAESAGTARRELVCAGLIAGVAVAMKMRDGAWGVLAALVALLAVRTLLDFAPGRGRPRWFPPLYAAHLLLPLVILAMVGFQRGLHRTVFMVAAAAALSGLLLLRQTWFGTGYRGRGGVLVLDVVAFVAGFVATTVPWVAYFAVTVGADVLWRQLVVMPTQIVEPMLRWPTDLYDMTGAVCLAVVGFGLAALFLFGRRRWPALVYPAAAVIFGLPAIVFAWPETARGGLLMLLPFTGVLAVVLVGRLWWGAEVDTLRLAVLATFAAVAPMGLYPWTDFNHWLWACGPAFVVVGFAAARLRERLSDAARWLGWAVPTAQVALVVLALPPILSPLHAGPSLAPLRGAVRSDVPWQLPSVRKFQPAVDFINEHVGPDEPIFELPTSFLCFMTGRPQAARLDYFFVVDDTTWDVPGEIEHLRRVQPRFAFVVQGDRTRWQARFPTVVAFLAQDYVLHARLGSILVYERRDGGAADPEAPR